MPNFASSLSDSYITPSENSFSDLSSSDVSSILSPCPPISCSSPVASLKKKPVTPSFRSLKIFNVNFQSVKNKKEEIGHIIDSVNPTIIMGTETWLNPSIHTSEIFIRTNNIICRDRDDGYGGVLLAIKNDLIYEEIPTTYDTESIFVKITLDKNKPLIIGTIYRPPSSSQTFCEDICRELENIKNKYKNAVLWIGGDLNLPDIKWATNSVEGNQNSIGIN